MKSNNIIHIGFEPASDSLLTQLVSLGKFLTVLEEVKQKGALTLDFSDIKWCPPLSILPIAALVERLERRGQRVKIIQPTNNSVANYLETISFPNGVSSSLSLKAGKTYLPILKFSSEPRFAQEQESLLSRLIDILEQKVELRSGSKNAIRFLAGEMITNIWEHAESASGWFLAQFFPSKNFLDLCIVDDGIIFTGSYRRHKISVLNDGDAIKKAREGFSTKKEETRGFGIPTSEKILRRGLKGEILIVSGGAGFYGDGEKETLFRTGLWRWPGTIIVLRVPKPIREVDIYKYQI